jgi:hypothetical protein
MNMNESDIIHNKIFTEIFNKNYDLYFEFIQMISQEYDEIIKNIKHTNTISIVRMNVQTN